MIDLDELLRTPHPTCERHNQPDCGSDFGCACDCDACVVAAFVAQELVAMAEAWRSLPTAAKKGRSVSYFLRMRAHEVLALAQESADR